MLAFLKIPAKNRLRFSIIFAIFVCVITCTLASCGLQVSSVAPSDALVRQSNGELSYRVYVSGNGEKYASLVDFNPTEASPYLSNTEKGLTLTLPDSLGGFTVKRIEDDFYSDRPSRIACVILPSKLEYIGNGALSSVESIAHIEIPASVGYIGRFALHSTAWLDAISDEFVIVGDGVLIDYNGSGGEVALPRTVKMISTAFDSGDAITSLTVNRGCREIISGAFEKSRLVGVSLPSTLKKLGSFAFASCPELESLNLPDGCELERCALVECDKLVLEVSRGGNAMRYAIERNIPFTFDGKLTHTRDEFSPLEPFGTLTLNYSNGFPRSMTDTTATFQTSPETAFPSGDGRLAICLDPREDGGFERLVIADLRTARIIAEQKIDSALVLKVLGRDGENPDELTVDGGFVPQGWDEHGFVFTCTATLSSDSSMPEGLSFSARRETVYEQTSTFNLKKGHTELTRPPQYLDGYTAIAESPDSSVTLYSLADAKGAPTERLLLSWTYGTINFTPEQIDLSRVPTITLADIDLDGRRDVVMFYTASESRERVEIFFGPTGSRRISLDPAADAASMIKIEKSDNTVTLSVGEESLILDSQKLPVIGSQATCRMIGNRICAQISLDSDKASPYSAIIDYGFDKRRALGLAPEYVALRSENDFTEAFETLEFDGASLCFLGDLRLLLVKDELAIPFTRDSSRKSISPKGAALYKYDLTGDSSIDPIITLANGRELLVAYSVTPPPEDDFFFETEAPAPESRRLSLLGETLERAWSVEIEPPLYPELGDSDTLLLSSPDGEIALRGLKMPLAAFEKSGIYVTFAADAEGIFAELSPTLGEADTVDRCAILRLRLESDDPSGDRLVADSLETRARSFEASTLTLSELQERLAEDGFEAEINLLTLSDIAVGEKALEIVVRSISGRGALITRISQSALERPIEADELLGASFIATSDKMALSLAERAIVLIGLGSVESIAETSLPDADGFDISFRVEDGRLICERSLATEPAELIAGLTGRGELARVVGEVTVKDGKIVLEQQKSENLSEIFDLDSQFDLYKDDYEGIGSLDELIAQNTGAKAISIKSDELSMRIDELRMTGAAGISERLIVELSDLLDTHLTLLSTPDGVLIEELTARSITVAPDFELLYVADTELSVFECGELSVVTAVSPDRVESVIFGGGESAILRESIFTDAMLTYLEPDGEKLRYRKVNAKYVGGVEPSFGYAIGRDELYAEKGSLTLDDGLHFTAESSETISDVADLNRIFSYYRQTDFIMYNTIERLFGHNIESAREFAVSDGMSLRFDRFSKALILSCDGSEYRYHPDRLARDRGYALDFDHDQLERIELYSAGEYVLITYMSSRDATFEQAAIIERSSGRIIADTGAENLFGISEESIGEITKIDCEPISLDPPSLRFTIIGKKETVMAELEFSPASERFELRPNDGSVIDQ